MSGPIANVALLGSGTVGLAVLRRLAEWRDFPWAGCSFGWSMPQTPIGAPESGPVSIHWTARGSFPAPPAMALKVKATRSWPWERKESGS